jgi:hypothetical protein
MDGPGKVNLKAERGIFAGIVLLQWGKQLRQVCEPSGYPLPTTHYPHMCRLFGQPLCKAVEKCRSSGL